MLAEMAKRLLLAVLLTPFVYGGVVALSRVVSMPESYSLGRFFWASSFFVAFIAADRIFKYRRRTEGSASNKQS